MKLFDLLRKYVAEDLEHESEMLGASFALDEEGEAEDIGDVSGQAGASEREEVTQDRENGRQGVGGGEQLESYKETDEEILEMERVMAERKAAKAAAESKIQPEHKTPGENSGEEEAGTPIGNDSDFPGREGLAAREEVPSPLSAPGDDLDGKDGTAGEVTPAPAEKRAKSRKQRQSSPETKAKAPRKREAKESDVMHNLISVTFSGAAERPDGKKIIRIKAE